VYVVCKDFEVLCFIGLLTHKLRRSAVMVGWEAALPMSCYVLWKITTMSVAQSNAADEVLAATYGAELLFTRNF